MTKEALIRQVQILQEDNASLKRQIDAAEKHMKEQYAEQDTLRSINNSDTEVIERQAKQINNLVQTIKEQANIIQHLV